MEDILGKEDAEIYQKVINLKSSGNWNEGHKQKTNICTYSNLNLMKILAFDCSLGPFSIALLDNDKVLSFVQNSQNKKIDFAKDFARQTN